jgi:3-phosphoshikimate 1-carboxyvinyltransferase
VCAALAEGTSRLDNLPDGDDTVAMVEAVRALGCSVDVDESGRATVCGRPGAIATAPASVHAGLAGTTSRFATALAATGTAAVLIDGYPALRTRPMGALHDALHQLGASIVPAEQVGCLPVTVRGPLTGQTVMMPGDVSSQFITALMLVAPTLPSGLVVQLTTPLVSQPYLGITAAVMAAFGVPAVTLDPDRVTVGAGGYVAAELVIEPDASTASYPLAAAAICGGRVHVPMLGSTSIQGDARFVDVLAAMGCDVERTETSTTVSRSGGLRGIDIDMVDMSDLVPTLAVVAAHADTPTRITGVGFIRNKESDRIADLCHELCRAGVDATAHTDGLTVQPSPRRRGAELHTHHDHRLAMSFALLGLSTEGIRIADPGVVSKSWPGFWDALEQMR